jgi:hypothetical protein
MSLSENKTGTGGTGPPPPPPTIESLLQSENDLLKAQVKALQAKIQRAEDLNLLTPYITSFYIEVYRLVRNDFISHTQGGFATWGYNSWVDLFNAAVVEMDDFNQGLQQTTPLNDSIEAAMMKLGKISRDEWVQLQEIRYERNTCSHPRMNDKEAGRALDKRWQQDPAGPALHKILRALMQPVSHRKGNKRWSS